MRPALWLLAATAALPAQDLGRKAPPQAKPIAIVGATIHPVAAPPLERGAVLFDRGTIAWLGPAAELPPSDDVLRIDAAGKHVYPGLISAVTALGLVEISSVAATRDDSETGDVTPEARAVVAVNPDATAIPVARSNGVLAAGTFPRGGTIAGRAGVIRLEGWTAEDMAVALDAGLAVQWPTPPLRRPGESDDDASEGRRRFEARRRAIDDAFAAARAYLAARAADPAVAVDVRWEAMRAALEGQRPVFAFANDTAAIEAAVLWAQAERLRLVIVGGRDAPACADLLARAGVAVIVQGTHRLPKRSDSPVDEAFALPAQLEAAGLRWCLASSGAFYNERNLPYEAATAVAHGLPHDAALRAITLSAAEILGVADRLGSLAVGKEATLFIADGDPLEITTRIERAFIAGREVDLRNRQTELAEKYTEKYRQLGLMPR